MTDAEQRAYSRGYSKGYHHKISCRWPDSVPNPPESMSAELVMVLKKLRDAYDGICSTLSQEDEIVTQLDPVIEEADEALLKLQSFIDQSVKEIAK